MPIPAGTRFGPYEIISAAGAGGMGEVYRAKDTRLDRIVAVKVLSSELAHDPEKRQRFEWMIPCRCALSKASASSIAYFKTS